MPRKGAVDVRRAGTLIRSGTAVNFIEGSNVTITAATDAANDRVNVTISSSGGGGGTGGGSFFPVVTPPTSSWTWINHASLSPTDTVQGDTIHIEAPGAAISGDALALYAQPIVATAPYQANLCFRPFNFRKVSSGTVGTRTGIFIRDSASGRFVTLNLFQVPGTSASAGTLLVNRTSSTSSGGTTPTYVDYWWGLNNEVLWMAVENDGTNLNFKVSANGINWYTFWSETIATYLNATPDQVGLVLWLTDLESSAVVSADLVSFEVA